MNRKWSPLVREADWDLYLSRSGFSGLDVALRDSEESKYHVSSIMISTNPKAEDCSVPLRTVVVTTEDSRLQLGVGDQLKLVGCDVISLSAVESTDFIQTECIFLPELDRDFLQDISKKHFALLQKIVSSARGLLWVTGGKAPSKEIVLGFLRCIKSEGSELKFRAVGLDESTDIPSICKHIIGVWREAFLTPVTLEYEMSYTETDGLLSIPRVTLSDRANEVHNSILSKTVAKTEAVVSLNSVHDLDDNMVEIDVEACGLDSVAFSSTDTVHSTGQEFAGVAVKVNAKNLDLRVGDRICGFSRDALQKYVRVSTSTVSRIPDDMTFESAAALPIDYCLSYYAIYLRGEVKSGESILIHAGATPLGQAAIQIAKLTEEVIIYTTVGSEGERKLLRQYRIPDHHILSSRTTTFTDTVMRLTYGRGVDVILNILDNRDVQTRSCECLAHGGRFVDVSRKPVVGTLPPNAQFATVNLNYLLQVQPRVIAEILRKVIDLVAEVKIRAPSPRVHERTHLKDALQSTWSGSSEKLVIRADANLVSFFCFLETLLGFLMYTTGSVKQRSRL